MKSMYLRFPLDAIACFDSTVVWAVTKLSFSTIILQKCQCMKTIMMVYFESFPESDILPTAVKASNGGQQEDKDSHNSPMSVNFHTI